MLQRIVSNAYLRSSSIEGRSNNRCLSVISIAPGMSSSKRFCITEPWSLHSIEGQAGANLYSNNIRFQPLTRKPFNRANA